MNRFSCSFILCQPIWKESFRPPQFASVGQMRILWKEFSFSLLARWIETIDAGPLVAVRFHFPVRWTVNCYLKLNYVVAHSAVDFYVNALYV